ncbi:MAG TPA: NAD(P)/FAD-dependent oxidoreductase [Vicinamibacterales bacterium]|nr:NAD(P)/FAD-dependent oxidoreductase [Vicinamibacterales bacterium]
MAGPRKYDVIIVGAGPAGLSAALMLGRCRRSVVVFDNGKPRNAPSRALHGYLTRDGIAPADFLRLARAELGQYDSVRIRDEEVSAAECRPGTGFVVTLQSGETIEARKLLLSTGVVDNLPDIPGFRELYGRSVFHCPYCDGWELCDQPLAIYGRGARGAGLSLELTAWSRDLVLCTDGPPEIEPDDRVRLERNGIAIREDRVIALEGADGVLARVVFENAPPLERRAVFFSTGQYQRSDLLERLGCEFNDKGTVRTGKYETTHLPGLFVAGDASRAVQWVVVAASEGAEAAFAINTDLLKEDLK